MLKQLLEDEERKRRDDLTYIEKQVKGQIDRVIVELKGNESGAMTRLAARYDRLDKAIKKMGEKKNELNEKLKGEVEELFAAEDIVLTRVVETVSFTMTVSKKQKQADKTTIDFEKIAEELAKLIPEELEEQVNEIYKAFTKITPQPDKSPALRVNAKIEEGVVEIASKFLTFVKLVMKKVLTWSKKYDQKLDALKKLAEI
jgi:hypothetical protein